MRGSGEGSALASATEPPWISEKNEEAKRQGVGERNWFGKGTERGTGRGEENVKMSDLGAPAAQRKSEGLELMANVLESAWAQGWKATAGWPTWNFDEGRAKRRTDHHGNPFGCCIAGAERFVELMFTGNLFPTPNLLPPQPPHGYAGWTQWNDAEGRTQQQVVEYLRNLAALERIQEAK